MTTYSKPSDKPLDGSAVGISDVLSGTCANHANYGCDPDGTGQWRDIYEGDDLLKSCYLCERCRAELIFSGLELIVPDNDRTERQPEEPGRSQPKETNDR